jgi:hypothetical protein
VEDELVRHLRRRESGAQDNVFGSACAFVDGAQHTPCVIGRELRMRRAWQSSGTPFSGFYLHRRLETSRLTVHESETFLDARPRGFEEATQKLL